MERRPASTQLEVPVALALSARIATGARWVEGDVLGVPITVRNRMEHSVHTTVTATAGGVAKLTELRPGGQGAATRAVDVPAGGARVVTFPVAALSAGLGEMTVKVQGAGAPDDTARHTWEVLAAGEPTTLVSAAWVLGRGSLSAAPREQGSPAMVSLGEGRVVLERGFPVALAAALEALDPDRMPSLTGVVDAIEVGERVRRWAVAAEGEKSALAARAKGLVDRAWGWFDVRYAHGADEEVLGLAHRLALIDLERTKATFQAMRERKEPFCPETGHPPPAGLDAEPPPEGARVLPCWDAFVSSTVADVTKEGDPEALALAFLALAERPHRTTLAGAVMARLREVTKPMLSGEIQGAQDRSARATIYAALLRGAASFRRRRWLPSCWRRGLACCGMARGVRLVAGDAERGAGALRVSARRRRRERGDGDRGGLPHHAFGAGVGAPRGRTSTGGDDGGPHGQGPGRDRSP